MRALSKGSRKITIEVATEVRDALGGVEPTWATHARVWAQRRSPVGQLAGRETQGGMQTIPETDTVFVIRHSSDVAAVNPSDFRINAAGTEYFDIVAVIPDPPNYPQTLELHAKRADV